MLKRIVAVLTAVLVASTFLAVDAVPASANSETCNSIGYTKIDSSSGSEAFTWGSITWAGQSLSYDLEPGWSVDLCLKSGAHAGTSTYQDVTGEGTLTISQGISHIGYKDPVRANGLTCDAATLYKPSALSDGDHINMDVVYDRDDDGKDDRFQVNAKVEKRQSQDPASESGLVVRVKLTTGEVALALTKEQVASGILTLAYSASWTGSWTVEWVQYNSSYFNQDRKSASFLHCQKDSPVVVAKAPSATAPTCDADGALVLPKTENITWTGGSDGDGPGTYTIVATPAKGYTLDGAQDTWVVQVLPKGTGLSCGPPPCIASHQVSYTYDPATNTGTVTVPNPAGSSGELCDGFWVTAVSWKFASSGVWPQNLDQNNPMPENGGTFFVDEPGTYSFGAEVQCGQGDIYASYDAQPVPTDVLTAPQTPFAEHFLHDMGFSGPTPTYTVDKPGCNTATPVAPVATPIAACGTDGSLTWGTTTGVVYALTTGNGTSGAWVLTATPAKNFYFDGPQVVTFSGNLGTRTECATPVEPVLTPATCDVSTGIVSSAFVTVPSTTGIDYRLGSTLLTPGSRVDLPTGEHTITVTAQGGYTNTGAASYVVRVLDVPDCDDPVEYIAPVVQHEICDATTGDVSGAELTFTKVEHLSYRLDGTELVFPTGATTLTVPVAAGEHTVRVDAEDGYYVTGTSGLTTLTETVVVNAPASCDKPVDYVAPTVVDEVCDADLGGSKDGIVTFTLPAHLSYVFDGVPVTSADLTIEKPAGTYQLVVTADSGYFITGGAATETFAITIDEPAVDCDELTTIPLDPYASPEQCVAGSLDGEKTDGSITIVKAEHVTWQISNDLDGVKHSVDTSGVGPNFVFAYPAGDYRVWATADPGYFLSTPTSFAVTVHEPTLDCGLPTFALLETGASWTHQVCSAGGLVDPTITIAPFVGVTYFIDGVKATQTTTTVATGSHTITAVADDPTNTVTTSSWTPTLLAASTTVCGDLTTLALTGETPGGWLLLAILLLQAGLVLVAVRFVRARRTPRHLAA